MRIVLQPRRTLNCYIKANQGVCPNLCPYCLAAPSSKLQRSADLNETYSFSIKNDFRQLSSIVARWYQIGEQFQIDEDIIKTINLALEEIVTNVISYGSDDTSELHIDITITLTDLQLTLVVADDAQAFDPLTVPTPQWEDSIDNVTPGGLGVHLVRTMMDDMSYERNSSRNILTMHKQLKQQQR